MQLSIVNNKSFLVASHAATPSLSQAVSHLFASTTPTYAPPPAQLDSISVRSYGQTSATPQRMAHSRSNSQPKGMHNPFLPTSATSNNGSYSPFGSSSKRKDSSDLSHRGPRPANLDEHALSQYPLAGSQELAASSATSPNRRTSAGQVEDEEPPAALSSVRNANLSLAREEAGGAMLRRQSGPAATLSLSNGNGGLRAADGTGQARHHSVSAVLGAGSHAGMQARPPNGTGQLKEARQQD